MQIYRQIRNVRANLFDGGFGFVYLGPGDTAFFFTGTGHG